MTARAAGGRAGSARPAQVTLPLSVLASPADVRARFVQAILERMAGERIVEAHLFSPIRQGGVETGIAVLAVRPEEAASAAGPLDGTEPAGPADDAPVPDETPVSGDATLPDDGGPLPERYVVYTATYRLVVKGPDRGRWEVSLVAEADAPLLTVDAVVRGVQRRAGDEAEPERFTGDALRALAAEPSPPSSSDAA